MPLIAGCLSDEAPVNKGIQPGTASASDNSPPLITGTPKLAVLVGAIYTFSPIGSDADGDPLTFSIENRPRWAEFDVPTGRLSGQVVWGDEGVYEGIRISVSDGHATRSLPDFSVTVSASADGVMTLSWTPPTENADGSALTDLAGYNIYFGEAPGAYTEKIRIDNPGLTGYVVENLLPTTYYIVVTAFNAKGIESNFSNMATKMVTQ